MGAVTEFMSTHRLNYLTGLDYSESDNGHYVNSGMTRVLKDILCKLSQLFVTILTTCKSYIISVTILGLFFSCNGLLRCAWADSYLINPQYYNHFSQPTFGGVFVWFAYQ
jgi:hypothetical protein